MSRLIDAKELINSRPENLNTYIDNDIESAYNKGWNACNSFWLKIIEEQLTACDIDKVIKEIKALIEFEFDWLRAAKYEEGCITIAVLDIAEMAIKSKAIEIVKKGGK